MPVSAQNHLLVCHGKRKLEVEDIRAEQRENLQNKANINVIFFILCLLGIYDSFS